MLFLFRMNESGASAVVAASASFAQVETSGVVSETAVTTNDLIDHAFRRCKIQPAEVTGENLDTASRLLHMNLTRLASKGIALWAIEHQALGLTPGVSTTIYPNGTVDVLNVNLRMTNRVTGTSSEPQVADDDLTTPYNYGFSGATYTLTLSQATNVMTIGLMPGNTATWDARVEYTTDGVTWYQAWLDKTFDVTNQVWAWVNLEGILGATAVRFIVASGVRVILNQIYFGNKPSEAQVTQLNRDEYSNLPDKTVTGRPVQYWLDKQRTTPAIHLWPAPSDSMKYVQLISYLQRHVEDVGKLSQIVEIPRRWYLAVINQLAFELAIEMPTVEPDRIQLLDTLASRTLAEAWDGETDSSKTKFRFNVRPYN